MKRIAAVSPFHSYNSIFASVKKERFSKFGVAFALWLLNCFTIVQVSAQGTQLQCYTFSATTGATLQDMTGATSLIASGQASGISTVQSIGFNFRYENKTYTQFSVNTEGMLRFGATRITAETTNNTVSATNPAKLFPFWENMSTGNNGIVSSKLVGTAPNRILVIHYALNTTNVTTAAFNIRMQIWLYESSNVIEFRYGSGVSAASASIGMGGVIATNYQNITVPANTSSSTVVNNTVTAWPGDGTMFVFSPAQISGVFTVGSGGNYATLEAAINDLNCKGVNIPGVTLNVLGGHTETVTAGTAAYTGILLTAAGTASSPIVIKWDGMGVQPIITAGIGKGNNDFVIGIGGSDYVTVDGLKIRENPANTTTNQLTEIGIGLFKSRYDKLVGNDGCHFATIKNNDIQLSRNGNAKFNDYYYVWNGLSNVYYYRYRTFYSKGIAALPWSGTELTPLYTTNNTSAIYQGILTDLDVHSNNTIISNTIDECFYGIYVLDRVSQSLLIGSKGNVIGRPGEGNTITNFGAKSGITYAVGATNYYYNIAKGISAEGVADVSIENNMLTNGSASYHGIAGIHVGISEDYQACPKVIGSFTIRNNVISNLSSVTTLTANNNSPISAINFFPLGATSSNGNFVIESNTITNLTSKLGIIRGISSVSYLSNTTVNTNVAQTSANQTSIKNNLIDNLTVTGLTTSALQGVVAIDWGLSQGTVRIEGNQIKNINIASAAVSPTSIGATLGTTGIRYYSTATAARSLVNVKFNELTNFTLNHAATAATGDVKLLDILSGGTLTNIDSNIVMNHTFKLPTTNLQAMYLKAAPPSGTSTLNVKGNSIRNIARVGTAGAVNATPYFTAINLYSTLAQSQFISQNVVDSLVQSTIANPTTTKPRIYGIHVIGSKSNTTTHIFDNVVSRLVGSAFNPITTLVAADNAPMAGISVNTIKIANIYRNKIFDLTQTQGASTFTHINSVTGIAAFSGNTVNTSTFNIYNNSISALYAPSLLGASGVNGMLLSYGGKFNVYHNTVMLGVPPAFGASAGGIPITSSAANWGATGIYYAPYTYHTTRKTTNANQLDLQNNLISVNATAKGTGAVMALRYHTVQAAKAAPGNILKSSTGNTYFVNPGTFNYIYGQGITANITGGIRNCFAVSSATANTTNNLANDLNFNESCGLYKSFFKGGELRSYVDISANQAVAPPFLLAGSVVDSTKLQSGVTSYVFTATLTPTVTNDLFGNSRSGAKVTAGAFETVGILPVELQTLSISYVPLDNSMCDINTLPSKKLQAQILPIVAGATVDSTTLIPRMYYKATTHSNLMPSDVQNVSTFNGWKWVNGVNIGGGTWEFTFDKSKLFTTGLVPTYIIEYFVIAQDNSTTPVVTWQGATFAICPTTVNIPNIPTAGTYVPDVGESDQMTIVGVASLTKSLGVDVNNTFGVANTTGFTKPGELVTIFGSFLLTATGEAVEANTYGFEIADNAAFTTNAVYTGGLTDSIYSFTMPTTQGTVKFARMWLECDNGVKLASSNTPYVALTVLDVPNVTNITDDYFLTSSQTLIDNIVRGNVTTASRSYFYFATDPTKTVRLSNVTQTGATGSSSISVSTLTPQLEGEWINSVGVQKIALANQGVKIADVPADALAKLDLGTGVAFRTNDWIKLVTASLKGGTIASSGFVVSLYDSLGTRIYKSAAVSVAAATVVSTALNWNIAPGAYMLVIEDANTDLDDDPTTNPPTGELLFFSGASFPYKLSTEVELLGGVDNINFGNLSTDANYFFDWDVTIYATGKTDKFDLLLKWVSATLSAVTCNATTGASNEDGKITIQNYFPFVQKVGYSIGSLYTGPDFGSADSILAAPYLYADSLLNPKVNQPYVIRAYEDANSFRDINLVLSPTQCLSSNLSLSLTPVTQAANKGESQTFTVVLNNLGPEVSTNVVVKVPIPKQRLLLAAQPSLGTYDANKQEWTISSLPVGSATMLVTLQVN